MENLVTSVGQRRRLADNVSEQLEKLILEGHLKPGTKLPTEIELCQQFNVSRTVVREAVNSLVAKGLLETRQGVGTTVVAVSRDTIVSSLNRFLHVQSGGVAFEDLHQVRVILELATAQLAASRATEEDLAYLRQILSEMPLLDDDIEAFASKDTEFHRALALASHNPLLVVLSDATRDLLKEYIITILPYLDMAADVHPYHRRILERVEAKDRKGARQAMWEHLTQAEWERFHGHELLE